MGRGQEQAVLRHRRLPKPFDEDEHVLDADGIGSVDADGPSKAQQQHRQQELVLSPSVRRKMQEHQERLAAARRGRAPSVATTTLRRKGLLACVWLSLVGLLIPAVGLLATAWRKHRSPHPIGFGAAWVSVITGLFPLIDHDAEHRIDLNTLHTVRRRLEASNMLNIGTCRR